MSKVAIVGYGNVGFHFNERLSLKGHETLIFSRNPTEKGHLPLSTLSEHSFDFILLTVPDDQIKEVGETIENARATVLHTSGSRPIDDLSACSTSGVLYPLQTFSKAKSVDFEKLQLFVEGDSPEVLRETKQLASSICPNVRVLTSDARSELHLAAVFACNFSNHMFHLAEEQLGKIGMKFQDLQPLVEETLNKALAISPSQAQTGPAVRNDFSTLSKHMDLLKDEKMRKMYKLITESIQQS